MGQQDAKVCLVQGVRVCLSSVFKLFPSWQRRSSLLLSFISARLLFAAHSAYKNSIQSPAVESLPLDHVGETTLLFLGALFWDTSGIWANDK